MIDNNIIRTKGVRSEAMNFYVSGSENLIGYNCDRVIIVGDRNTVADGCSNVLLFNTSDVDVTESDVVYVDGVRLRLGGQEAGDVFQFVGGEWVGTRAGQTINGIVFVSSKDDLPTPVSGVIYLDDETTYFITTDVDLDGDRIVAGQDTSIIGGSSESCVLRSTGLTGVALITSLWSLPMRNVSVTADVALDLDASGNPGAALDWFGVNFVDCPTIGTVANYANFIAQDCGFLNSAGMSFEGSIGTVGFSQCIFDVSSGDTMLSLAASATITRRFRIIYSAFVAQTGETCLDVDVSSNIPVEGYILDTVSFSGGGTYVSGVQHTDNKALWVNNKGINNSASLGFMTMSTNVTPTVVAEANVAYKAAGTTTLDSVTQKFEMPLDNRLSYVGAITRHFKVTVTATLSAGNNQRIGIYVAKNGSVLTNSENYSTTNASSRVENMSCQTIVELQSGNYVEVFVENDTHATNIVVERMSVIVEALN